MLSNVFKPFINFKQHITNKRYQKYISNFSRPDKSKSEHIKGMTHFDLVENNALAGQHTKFFVMIDSSQIKQKIKKKRIKNHQVEVIQVLDLEMEREQVLDQEAEREQVLDQEAEQEQVLDQEVEQEQVLNQEAEREQVLDQEVEQEQVLILVQVQLEQTHQQVVEIQEMEAQVVEQQIHQQVAEIQEVELESQHQLVKKHLNVEKIILSGSKVRSTCYIRMNKIAKINLQKIKRKGDKHEYKNF